MLDMHYDLLSILYYAYIKDDYSYITKIKNYFNSNNVVAVVANLYFMNEEEMLSVIGKQSIDVCQMFKISVDLFKKHFPNLKAIFSIEGCDYIKDLNELKTLRKLGLQSILLVWNNPNKYGSGIRSDQGLTWAGKEFLKEAIKLGITIDLSHMNKKTFYDTLEVLKEYKNEAKVIVSHSNCYELCNNPRNIDDEQIKALREFNPVMGIVTYPFFLTKDVKKKDEIKELYLDHITYAINILGIDNVGVSTDDMGYDKYFFAKDIVDIVFPYDSLKKDLENLLSKRYNREEINKILYKNGYDKLLKEEEI